MFRISMRAVTAGLMFLAVLPASADDSGALPPPSDGFAACAPDDPLTRMETRLASSIGGTFLSCFHSRKEVTIPIAGHRVDAPQDYAFAIRLAGDGFTTADLDRLLATVKKQWKDFQPIGKALRTEYIARLNALIAQASDTTATFSEIKPVLVSINRLDDRSYTVVSIRSYVIDKGGAQDRFTKVNADALVLRGKGLIRLTVQRQLMDAADADELQAEIAQWARAVAGP